MDPTGVTPTLSPPSCSSCSGLSPAVASGLDDSGCPFCLPWQCPRSSPCLCLPGSQALYWGGGGIGRGWDWAGLREVLYSSTSPRCLPLWPSLLLPLQPRGPTAPAPSFMTCLWLGRGDGRESGGPGCIIYNVYFFNVVVSAAPVFLCAAHSLVCVCGIVMSWGEGRGWVWRGRGHTLGFSNKITRKKLPRCLLPA